MGSLRPLALACVALQCGGKLEPVPTIGDDGTTYNSVNATSAWSAVNVEKVLGVGWTSFNGGTFDGRYVYLAPEMGGVAYRFDTRMPMSAANAWETFDTKIAEAPPSLSFCGTAFDGRYVYWSSCASVVFRYDTHAAFGDASAWSSFDRSALGQAFTSIVSDGRYLFFMPFGIGHTIARYDIQQPFDDPGSWTTFDVASVIAGANDFAEGAFDGRFIYALGNDAHEHAILVRYDTEEPFAATSSWTLFDPSVVESTGHLKRGIVFDGRFLYIGNGPNADMLRYDTHATFSDASSWTVTSLRSMVPSTWEHVDIAALDFDGRFVYLDAEATHLPSPSGVETYVVQCDTQTLANGAAACASFDATSSLMSALGGGYGEEFYTSVFDGRFLYFASGGFTVVARFDVKSPPSMPLLPAFHGSFF